MIEHVFVDGHVLAGFIEGEAHFGIVERNGGASAGCLMSLKVRDDDAELLRVALETIGIGTIVPATARDNSAPQVSWNVRRRDECRELATFLERFPLRGRKRRELMIWKRALRLWTQKPHGWVGAMRALRGQLRQVRAFRESPGRPVAVIGRRGLEAYITGLAMAEGYFEVTTDRARFAMHVRCDDAPLLEALAAQTGLGKVYYSTPRAGINPSATWLVHRQSDTQELARLFLDAGFTGRKRAELDAWTVAVEHIRVAREAGRPRSRILMRAAREQLARARCYATSDGDLRARARQTVNARAIEALVRWSDQSDNSLSATSYTRWRRRHDSEAPNRNTIAEAFGSWYDALVAAGLQDRAARGRTARHSRAGTAAHDARQRQRILVGVRRCVEDTGRVPTVTEFMAWRWSTQADVPSHGVVYRVFEDGWAGVLEAGGFDAAPAGRTGV